MTILIDMDDVLEQLVVGWVDYLNDRHGTCARPCDVTEWDMCVAFPTLTEEQVYAAINDDSLWDYVQPMPGAVETLQQLMAEGHEIYIVTATSYETLRYKMEHVLFRFFPFLSWEQVIITRSKHLIHGDVLIDDGPHNLTRGTWHKILFDAYHNHNFDETSVGAVRVHNWQEAYTELCRIAEEVK